MLVENQSINQSMWVLDTIYTVASLSLAVCDVWMCVAFQGHPKSCRVGDRFDKFNDQVLLVFHGLF